MNFREGLSFCFVTIIGSIMPNSGYRNIPLAGEDALVDLWMLIRQSHHANKPQLIIQQCAQSAPQPPSQAGDAAELHRLSSQRIERFEPVGGIYLDGDLRQGTV
jgi:hypothetical protein